MIDVIYILYNPCARNCQRQNKMKKHEKMIKQYFNEEVVTMQNIQLIESHVDFINSIDPADKLVVMGGDGTLNNLVNKIDFDENKLENIYFFNNGMANDFLKSLNIKEKIIPIYKYLTGLPKMIVKEKTRKFLNGVGIGIDGLVCRYIDMTNTKKTKKLYYQAALKAIKEHEPFCLDIEIDSENYRFENVQLCSIMNAPYYGGINMSPFSNRVNDYLDVVVVSNMSKKKILNDFPKVYKGRAMEKNNIQTFKGHVITVKKNTQYGQMYGEPLGPIEEFSILK